MSRLSPWARYLWLALALLVLVPPALVLVLAHSPRLLARALETWVPALSFDALSGTPTSGLVLAGARYRDTGLEFSAARLRLGVGFAWPATLVLAPLEIEQARLVLAPSDDASAAAWPRLPFVVHAPGFELRGLELQLPGRRLALERVVGDVEFAPRRLTLRGLAVQAQGQVLSGDIELAAGPPLVVQATLAGHGRLEDQDWQANLALHGPLAALKVEASLAQPWTADLTARLDVSAATPRIAGELHASPPAGTDIIGPLRVHFSGDADALELRLASALSLAGRAAAARLEGRLERRDEGLAGNFTWHYAGTPAAHGRGDFTLDAAGARLALDAAAPFTLGLRARALFEDGGPQLGARLTWQDAGWPPDAAGPRSDGTLQLRSVADELVLRGSARLRATPLGQVELALRGSWREPALRIAALDLRLLRGHARARGTLRTAPAPCLDLQVEASGLDFAALDPALHSALALRGAGGACRAAAGWRAHAELAQLDGQWRGQAVRGAARYRFDAGRQHLDEASLRVGANRLHLAARLDDALSGEFTLAARDLDTLLPDLRGRLEGSGTLAGTLAAPRLAAELRGSALGFGAWRAAALDGRLDVDFGRARPSSLSVTLSELVQGRRALGELALAASGDARAQRFDLTLRGGGPRLVLAAEGEWRAPAWQGRLLTTTVGAPQIGNWHLAAPAALTWRADGVALARACLEQSPARLCLAVPRWDAAGGTLELQAKAVPLSLTQDWLPTTFTPRGALDLAAHLERDGTRWGGRGTAHIARGTLVYRAPGRPVERVPIERARATFALDDERLTATVDAALGKWLSLVGEVDAGMAADAPWRGTLALDLPDIAWVQGFVPELAGSAGQVRVDATLGGSRSAPSLLTHLAFHGATLHLPRSGTRIEQLDLRLRGWPAGDVALEGSAVLGAGTLHLAGQLRDLMGDTPRAELRLDGENLALLRLPDIEADVSPALTLDISATEFALGGSVRLPTVTVDLRELPDKAVAVSSDEVVVGAAAARDGEAAALPRTRWFADTLSADLDLVLGDHVTLSGAGLEAKLAGAVHWTKPRHDDRGRGSGRLTITEGSYKAYGQALSVKSGALMFAGAIDNPALEVRAVRADIDVVAGVRVSGNLRAPRFQLFAEPSLPDAEVLSYLVTGHALGEASSGEADIIARAALGLGTERAALITGQLSSLFALDELGINAGASASTSSIVAGKRLTPKLTVRSEFNPFERLWTFFLNYKLSPRWSVEAQTGAGQGADLIYSVERERLGGGEAPSPAAR